MPVDGVLVLKIVLTPALIGLISLVERKFGHGVAGWFAAPTRSPRAPLGAEEA